MKRDSTARISDAAVRARTGKDWAEWFAILDAAGARKMNHRQIVAYLGAKHGEISGWWQQMVTVTYEQARGLRERHEKPGGYEISVSKTIAAPVADLYKAWQDEKTRLRWLPERGLVVRKATANKSMRIAWTDGQSSLSVNFYPKGNGKSQVVVQHGKLPDAGRAAQMKTQWARRLDRLNETLSRTGG